MPFSESDQNLTDHSIAHILSEAQQCLSPDSSQNRRLQKYDDIPQDFRGPGASQGLFLPPWSSGNPMVRTQDEIPMTLDVHHREMIKLDQGQSLSNRGILEMQQQAQVLRAHNSVNGVQDLFMPKDTSSKNRHETDRSESSSQSVFSLVRPQIEPSAMSRFNSAASSRLDNFAVASPLQRMDAIATSMISQHNNAARRPRTTGLPPITQEQFRLYDNLNTLDIAEKVKEQLSRYSIRRELFGDVVLGVSRTYVRELLTQPREWPRLMRKGREHFIRMKMFLEDENAVHKLIVGDYRIAKQKQHVLVSKEQEKALHLAFVMDRYPNVPTIKFLAQELNLSSRTIFHWFSGQRSRSKLHGIASNLPPPDPTGKQPPFDPIQFRLLLKQRLSEVSKERMGLGGVGLP